MTILVTGATGFIGRHLVKRLITAGEHVKAFVRPSANAVWLDALGVEIVRGDIGDADAVARAADTCKVMFHLAATTESSGLLSRHDVQVANIQGAENVTRAALQAGIERLVFCSSVAVYGRIAKNRLIDESTETDPDSPYGESKVLGEQIVLSARRSHGLPVVVARISTVWGPGTTSWLGLFRSIAAGQFRLIGEGRNYHHIADVSDVVEGLLLCGSVKGVEGRTYLLAGNEPVQLRRLVEMIGEEVGTTRFPANLPAAPLHVYRALDRMAVAVIGRQLPRADRLALFLGDRRFDSGRARQELGYVPEIATKDTIHRMVEWFLAEGHLSRLG
ncbi:NAD-dependent epimerase/dehydratase family protein [Nitrospira lenta]|uniref:Putative NAD-dependent epimerase/dehydratase n=1 Tax=Nitrospira lenta TaxID=1436998 RepID=A0A330L1K3_9BACT|nr:NAD-dependent epimerase/dehydratase family protein [Nitrospira lenta]SPP63638.1 putative NAD-dependent epimerase/dehydratase [Nitrospira lenta]